MVFEKSNYCSFYVATVLEKHKSQAAEKSY